MKKIRKIQGLRGLAISLVVISHIFPAYNYAGAFGVSVFIGLSGYLTVFNAGVINKARYDWKWYIRKLLRIYPLYLTVTLISSTYFNSSIVYGVDERINRIALLMNIFMIQTYSRSSVYWGAFSQVGWYIPLFVLTMILTPLIMRFLEKIDSYIAFVFLIIILYMEFFLCIFENILDAETMKWFIYLFPPFRVLEFIAGGCIAIINRDKLVSRKKAIIADISIIVDLVLVLCLIKVSKNIGGLLFLNAVWILPVWGLLASLEKSSSKIVVFLFENPFISFIGDISFEMFLCHLCVYHYCYIWFSPILSSHFIFYLVIFVTIVVVSALIHLLNKKINSIVYNFLIKNKGIEIG